MIFKMIAMVLKCYHNGFKKTFPLRKHKVFITFSHLNLKYYAMWNKSVFIFTVFVLSVFSVNSFAQSPLKLENRLISAEFDPSTGALVSYKSKQTGWEVIKRQELGQSFQMLIPLPDRRYNNAYGIKQQPPLVTTEANAITFVWNGIVSDHFPEALPIQFTGKVEINECGLVFSGSVENNSGYDVEYICWPYFGELSIPDKEDNLVWQTLEYGLNYQREIYPYFYTHLANHGVDYPTQYTVLPERAFLLIRNSKEGFSVICDDPVPTQLVQCVFELIPGTTNGNIWEGFVPKEDEIDGQPVRLVFKANHILYAHTNETVHLTPVMLKPFEGTWHRGVDHYKAWRKTWHKAPPMPEWLQEVHSWIQIQINSSEDYLNFRYADLVDFAKECKEYGVRAIQLTGWNNGGRTNGILHMIRIPGWAPSKN